MKSIGGLLALLGAGSFGLHMVGREFTLLSWVDTWGPTVGNAIRIGMIVVGGALFFMGASNDDDSPGMGEPDDPGDSDGE